MSNILTIRFPEDFEERYNEYKTRLLGVQKIVKEDADIVKIQGLKERPFCIVEKGLGFLKFNKHTKGIEIGRADSQPFKLLQCQTEPFGTAKTVDTVFEAIRENVKYKSKTGVYTKAIDKQQKVKLIEYAIKELQKNNKLQGKLKFRWDDLKTKVWLEYLG